jgi:hypothetical protein
MADSVFRSKTIEPEHEEQPTIINGDTTRTSETDEVQFTDYLQQHKHPFLVDHFQLGDTWADKYGGFKEEIDTIEGYFRERIEQGQMDNSLEAVKEKFKEIYKLCKIDKTERTTMQMEKLAAYIKFLKDTQNIEDSYIKYGNHA